MTALLLIASHSFVAALWWVIRGRVEARRLRLRDAAEAIERLGDKQWIVKGIVMPNPGDSRWKPVTMAMQPNDRKVSAIRIGSVIVSAENVTFVDEGTTLVTAVEEKSAYAQEVLRCFRQRLVDKSTKEPT